MQLDERIHVISGGWTVDKIDGIDSFRDCVLDAEAQVDRETKPKQKRAAIPQYDFLNIFDKSPLQIEIDFNHKFELTRN
jgi:hypothetical protein